MGKRINIYVLNLIETMKKKPIFSIGKSHVKRLTPLMNGSGGLTKQTTPEIIRLFILNNFMDNNKPAFLGGIKLRQNPMPSLCQFTEEVFCAVKEVFDFYHKQNKDFGYQGEFEKRYTDAFSEYMEEGGFTDAVATGTVALFVAIAALQLPVGSKVLVSPVTDPGTVNAIILNGLVPVIADSQPNSFNIGVEQFRARLNNDIRAAVIVHIGGKAAEISEICEVAKESGIKIIEDCSQAHGAKYEGRKVGNFGDLATFSTMYRKNHSSGGCGGLVYTKDENLYNLMRATADRGKPFGFNFDEKDPGEFLFPALNLNLDELSCAIGLKSLNKLDEINNNRRDFLYSLDKKLTENSHSCRLLEVTDNDSPFFWPIVFLGGALSCSKVEFAEALAAEGIGINCDYRYIVSEWPYVKKYMLDDFIPGNAIAFRDNSFNLLFNENYGKKECDDIVEAISKIEDHFKFEELA